MNSLRSFDHPEADLRWHAPLMKKAAPEGRPCMSHEVPRRSDSRAPRSLDKAIALTVLFHVPERRERRVERLHEHLVGDQHVEHFSPCRFRHVRNLIEEGVPAGI